MARSQAAERPLSELTDDELAARAAELAGARTAIRLEQLAIAGEIDARRALAGLSPAARAAIRIRLGGDLAVGGEIAAEGDQP